MDNQVVRCKNCDLPLTGKYCANCGQPVFERFNFAYLWSLLHRDLFEVDRGLWRTIKDLTIKPGYMIQDFLGGRTQHYFSPLKYLLVSVTVFYLTITIGDLISDTNNTFNSNEWTKQFFYNDHAAFSVETLLDFFAGYFPIILTEHLTLYFLVFIPFLALSTRIVFKKYNFIEYIITHTFLWGNILLVGSIVIFFTTLLWAILFSTTNLFSVYFFILLGLSIGVALFRYWALAFKQLHQLSWGKTILKFILALYSAFIPFCALLILGFMILKTILV